MKTLLTKLLCTLIACAILIVPAAALAEDETADYVLTMSEWSRDHRALPVGKLDPENLYLNGFPFDAPVNKRGKIVVRTIDFDAAKAASAIIAEYDASHPDAPFNKENLCIQGGDGIKLVNNELPDLKSAAEKFSEMEFPEELRDDSIERLGQALTALEQILRGDHSKSVFTDKIQSILNRFAPDTRFTKSIIDVYLLLYDIRADIAHGNIPSSILTDEVTTNLLTIFRDILVKGGLDLDEIEFWKSDEAWTAWAATKVRAKISRGDTFTLSDNKLTTTAIRIKNVVPEPPSPDEYVYEPPPPPYEEPEVPA